MNSFFGKNNEGQGLRNYPRISIIHKTHLEPIGKTNNLELTVGLPNFVFQCGPIGFVGIGEPSLCQFERDHIIRYGRIALEILTHERARTI